MRTLTIPLNAASPRARLVIAEQAAGVALWLSEPDIRSVRDRRVRTGSIARHHLAELGEFLRDCPEPDYEPGPGQDRATWLAHFAASGPRPPFSNLDLRLNRGRTDVRAGRPQGLLCSPLLLATLNVPVLRAGEDPAAHSTGAKDVSRARPPPRRPADPVPPRRLNSAPPLAPQEGKPMTVSRPAALSDTIRPPLPTPLHTRLWNGLSRGTFRGSVRRDGANGRRLLTLARQWEEEGLVTIHTLGRQGWVADLVPALRQPASPSRAPEVRLGVLGEQYLHGTRESDFDRAALRAVKDAVCDVFGDQARHFTYAPVRTDLGELAGWTWQHYHRTHWVSVDGAVSPNDITEQEIADWKAAKWPFPVYDPAPAQQAVRAAYEAHREVSAVAKAAARRVWPAAAGFRPVEEEGETIGYVFRAGPFDAPEAWVTADGSTVDHLGHDYMSNPRKALCDAHQAAVRERAAAAVGRQPLPHLDEDQARAVLDEPDRTAVLYPVTEHGRLLGYLARVGKGMAHGYGWVTVCRSRHLRPEDSWEDAETVLRAALADDLAQGRTSDAEPRSLQPQTTLLTVAAAREKVAGAGSAGKITVAWTEVRSTADDELIGWEFGLLPLHEGAVPSPGWITRRGTLSTAVRYPRIHLQRLGDLIEQVPAQRELLEMAYAHAVAKASTIPA
ncbi:hypothetical protein [Streptomyces sp. NPDC058861]|uniref:hypothetical protein n=1 Tax=Streptomyces sp. NPDC058861 TaxID=3346653 RepID=UPI0036C94574